MVAPAASRSALAAVPAGALTGSPVAARMRAGCETFDPVSLLTTAAELERLGESLDATGGVASLPVADRPAPFTAGSGRRLRLVFVIDPVPEAAGAMQDHGIAVEVGARPAENVVGWRSRDGPVDTRLVAYATLAVVVAAIAGSFSVGAGGRDRRAGSAAPSGS